MNIKQINQNKISCSRKNGRSIDHIFANGESKGKTIVKEMKTADHKMIINEIRI